MQKVLIVEDDTIQLNMLYQTIHDAYPSWNIFWYYTSNINNWQDINVYKYFSIVNKKSFLLLNEAVILLDYDIIKPIYFW